MLGKFKVGDQVFYSHPGLVKLSTSLTRVTQIKIAELEKLRDAPLSEIIFQTTGFEPITTDIQCGGFFDANGKRIAINEEANNPFEIFCHEIGHWIHVDSGIDYYRTSLLSDQVRFEHEAEAMGKMIYEAVTGKEYTNTAYFNIDDIKWLGEWYGDWFENDLINDNGRYNENNRTN